MATPRESWEKWASVYPRSKVFVGVVASPDPAAAPAGYMSPRELYYRVLQFVTKKPNYGGIVVWNRFFDKETGFSRGL
jgi:chitinase